MGKAIIVNGMVVRNPLSTISIIGANILDVLLDQNSKSATIGDTFNLTATVVTEDGREVIATFSSSDNDLASITTSGNTATVICHKKGACMITAKAGSKSANCSVSIATNASIELAEYYSANTSVSATEKTALNAFVTSMLDANLWDKMKYFYPMLGDSVETQLIEAISPSTEDLYSQLGDYGNLSVTNRILNITAQVNTEEIKTINASRFNSVIDYYNKGLSIISVFYHGGNFGGIYSPFDLYTQGGSERLRIARAKTQVPLAIFPDASGVSTTVTSTATKITYSDVYSCASMKDGVGSIYQGETQTSKDVTPFDFKVGRGTQMFLLDKSGASNEVVKPKILAIGDGLTSDEWGTIRGFLQTFLTAIGK